MICEDSSSEVPFISISAILADKPADPVVCALVKREKTLKDKTPRKTSVTKIRGTEERVYIRFGGSGDQTEQRIS